MVSIFSYSFCGSGIKTSPSCLCSAMSGVGRLRIPGQNHLRSRSLRHVAGIRIRGLSMWSGLPHHQCWAENVLTESESESQGAWEGLCARRKGCSLWAPGLRSHRHPFCHTVSIRGESWSLPTLEGRGNGTQLLREGLSASLWACFKTANVV